MATFSGVPVEGSTRYMLDFLQRRADKDQWYRRLSIGKLPVSVYRSKVNSNLCHWYSSALDKIVHAAFLLHRWHMPVSAGFQQILCHHRSCKPSFTESCTSLKIWLLKRYVLGSSWHHLIIYSLFVFDQYFSLPLCFSALYELSWIQMSPKMTNLHYRKKKHQKYVNLRSEV